MFNVPPTAKVIGRRGHSLESHVADWRSLGSKLGLLGTRPVVYPLISLTEISQNSLTYTEIIVCKNMQMVCWGDESMKSQ